MTTPLASSLPLAFTAVCCALAPTATAAPAENERRSYDFPAGDAAERLKDFAKTAELQVVYMVDDVRGLMTSGVRGEFTTREALDRMLANTDLVAVEDAKTKALMIHRRERSEPTAAPQAARPKSDTRKPNAVGRRNPIAVVVGWIALGLASVQGQTSTNGNLSATVQATGNVTGRVKNAVTGQYLHNARVSLKDTALVVQTDSFGIFKIVGAPPGSAVLEAFYTGLDPWKISLIVPPGGTVEQDVSLSNVARYGLAPDVVKLDAFVVQGQAETESEAVATNEQRFSPNIKSVVSTEALGDVLGNSVGEFLKFMPGVTVDHGGNEIQGISLRGISGSMTTFTTDGSPMVWASYAGPERAFNMYTQDINDTGRIEITKVPTPSSPADSLGGTVNMISKSAFDRDRPQFRYGLSLVGNQENLTLGRTPDSHGDRNTRKVMPGVNFDYTLPISKRFGIVLTGLHLTKTGEIHQLFSIFQNSGTGTGASTSRPYFRQHQLLDGPRTFTRTNFSAKADWKVTNNSVLSLNVQWNRHGTQTGTMTQTVNAGTVGTPTVAGGTALRYGEDYTEGATGRGAVNLTTGFQTFGGGTIAPSLNYRFDDGRWKMSGSLNGSKSKITRDNWGHGHFQNFSAATNQPLRISFSGISPLYIERIRAFTNNNQEIDINDGANYVVSGADDNYYHRIRTSKAGNFTLKRRLQLLPFPSAVEIGAAQRIQDYDGMGYATAWNYAGLDGDVNTAEPIAPYRMQVYVNQDPHYGFSANIPWVSPDRAWSAFQSNPKLFSQTPAQLVAQETSRLTTSQYIEETVSAGYVQAEASLWRGRLNVLGGVRFEKTTDKGEGPLYDPAAVYGRNADGSFARDSRGQRIRRIEAGAVGSMDELKLTRRERAYRAERSYDGVYPSLHLTVALRENLLLRAAYARTYGRPDFGDIIPTATVAENDIDADDLVGNPSLIQGNITVTNTGLRPWTADNYDLSIEYYTQAGGLVSAGIFRKDIDDFFGNLQKIATAADVQELGIDPRYVGWRVNSRINAGSARITGIELSLRQSLGFLGRWGSAFNVFANGTKLDLDGNQQTSFETFIPKSANWGVSYNRNRFSVTAKWNYQGLDRRTPNRAFGPDGYLYYKERTMLDLGFGYQLSRNLSLALSITNALYAPTQTRLEYGSETPPYARQSRVVKNGIPIALSLKGRF